MYRKFGLVCLAMAAVLMLCACGPGASSASGETLEWLGYTLRIRSFSEDKESDGANGKWGVLALEYTGGGPVGSESEEGIWLDTINKDLDFAEFVLQGPEGNEYQPVSIRYRGLQYDSSSGFTVTPVQQGFELNYDLPKELDFSTVSLVINGQSIPLAAYM